jgi:hypothetical protein
MSPQRARVREFNLAFERPVNDRLVDLSKEDRVLLGNLIIEETLEYVTKGLGLTMSLTHDGGSVVTPATFSKHDNDTKWWLTPSDPVDPIECADGLGDVNVIIHFNSWWQGIDLDAVDVEIHRSNMSKLGEDGKPIINGVTPGYRGGSVGGTGTDEPGYDPTRPPGKILKGPNYSPANIAKVLGLG